MELLFVVMMLVTGVFTISYFLRWLVGIILVGAVNGIIRIRERWILSRRS